jgi:hypothetical protein
MGTSAKLRRDVRVICLLKAVLLAMITGAFLTTICEKASRKINTPLKTGPRGNRSDQI